MKEKVCIGKRVKCTIWPEQKFYATRVNKSQIEKITKNPRLGQIKTVPFTSKTKGTWCFIVQNFDPGQDLEEEEE